MVSTFLHHRLSENEELSSKEKDWLACAIISAVISDENIATGEVAWLKEALNFLEGAQRKKWLKQIKSKAPLPLEPIFQVKRETAAKMFIDLVTIAMENMDLRKSEAAFLIHAAEKLGIRENRAREVLRWAHDLIKKFEEREGLVQTIASEEGDHLK